MKKLLLFSFISSLAFAAAAQAPNSWTQKANVGSTGRSAAVGFSIGSKGYIGTGTDGTGNYRNDFWEYDPESNTWSQKANFGGPGRSGAAGFSIGNKGYIGTGNTTNGQVNDFWEYNQPTNTWTQKAFFSGPVRWYAAGLSIGSKGYIGTGQDNANSPLNDFWEYDPAANTWTQKPALPGGTRFYASAFTIGQKGYIGLGFGIVNPTDLWEFDPATNVWTQMANFGGSPRAGAVAFSVDQKAYIATGHNGTTWINDVWQFDLTANNWTQVASFTGGPRAAAAGFSIGQKGYVGTGYNGSIWAADFWEYTLPAQLTISPLTLASTNLCPGEAIDVPFTTPDVFNGGNVFSAQLSNAAGSFASPTTIGTLSGTGSGTIQAVIPAGTPPGSMYRVRVVASNPGTTGPDSGDDIIISAPPVASFSGLPASVCASAGAVTLTGTTPGGTFSGPGISGFLFNPAAAGTGVHTITYTVGQGTCSNSSTQQVTVTAAPAATITGAPASACSNEPALALTGTPAGGTFSGTGISGNSFNPAQAGAGTHTITYTANQGGCTTTATQQITVNATPAPAFTLLPSTVCSNAPAIPLTATPAGGTFSGNGISGSSFDPAQAGAGLHTLTYTVTAGGCTGTSTQQIMVNAAPVAAITGMPGAVCSNTPPMQLFGSPAGGTFSGNGIIGNFFNAVAAGAGTHAITYTVTAGGCTDATTQQILVNAAPSAAFSFTNTLTTYNFTASAAAATYSWSFGDGNNSAQQNPVHTYAAAGTYTVTLTTSNAAGCVATTVQQVSVISGTAAAALSGISLYPNPAESFIRIENRSGLDVIQMELYSLTGQRVLETRLTGESGVVDVCRLAAGAYVARLTSGTLSSVQKVLISR